MVPGTRWKPGNKFRTEAPRPQDGQGIWGEKCEDPLQLFCVMRCGEGRVGKEAWTEGTQRSLGSEAGCDLLPAPPPLWPDSGELRVPPTGSGLGPATRSAGLSQAK